MSSMQHKESLMLNRLLKMPEWKDPTQNRQIFLEMLSSAIVHSGDENELLKLFDFIDKGTSKAQPWVQDALLNGVVNSKGTDGQGRIRLSTEPSNSNLTRLPESLASKIYWPGKLPMATTARPSDQKVDSETYAKGRQLYLNLCINCHGGNGEGIRRFAPPLVNSEWVKGKDYKLSMILLHGIEGPITVNGKKYDQPEILPVMPSFSTLHNEEIAAISTYIRNAWGHSESEITARSVGNIRFRTQGRIVPWKASELDTLVYDPEL